MKTEKQKQNDAKRKVEELQEKDWNNSPGKEKAPEPTPYNPSK